VEGRHESAALVLSLYSMLKKVGLFAVVGLLGLLVIGLILGPPESPAPSATSQPVSAVGPEPVKEGSGRSGRHAYTFMRTSDGMVVQFDPAIAADDGEALSAAMRHVLATDFGISGAMTTRQVGPAIRFITGQGAYDVAPTRERDGGPFTGLVIRTPQ
jgi:hypothetical protein